jgi:hypothetical protein
MARVNTCPYCGQQNAEKRADGELRLRCEQCGGSLSVEVPTEEEIRGGYVAPRAEWCTTRWDGCSTTAETNTTCAYDSYSYIASGTSGSTGSLTLNNDGYYAVQVP